jgi:invasion protein IalB
VRSTRPRAADRMQRIILPSGNLMNTTRKFAAALAISAFALSQASAQNAPAPTVTDSHTSGDWNVRCLRAATTVCEMTQFVVERSRNLRIASVAISYVPKSDSYLGRFGVPLGVAFDKGLGLEFGTFRANNLRYRVCERDACYVAGILPGQMIDAMRSLGAGKGAMDIQMIDGRKLQIPIVLNGFGDGLDLLKKWTVEKAGGEDKPDKK